MDFLDLAMRRESCRDFSNRPVEREKLEKMIEAARIAPSACNGQSWFFTVVREPGAVARVADCCAHMGMNKFARTAQAFIICEECKPNLTSRLGGGVKNQQFTNLDLGLAVMQICLEATDQGLSTCILGWFQEEKLKKMVPLKGGRVRVVVAVGYAKTDAIRPKKRKKTEEISCFVE